MMSHPAAYFARTMQSQRLAKRLEDLRTQKTHFSDAAALKDHLQPVLKSWLSDERAAMREHFFDHLNGTRVMRWMADGMDELLAQTIAYVKAACHPAPSSVQWSVLATGGYGRRELFVYSDVDLLILVPTLMDDTQEKMLQTLLYLLWDMGLKVGHRVVTLDEALKNAFEDLHFQTSLLDARYLAGNVALADDFLAKLAQGFDAHSMLEFVEEKLNERDARHQRVGDSRFVLQPHVKDAKGGLRDLHTLYWLARRAYQIKRVSELVSSGLMTTQEYRAYWRAAQFLSTVRMALHWLAGRAEDRLTFDTQRLVAQALGYRGTPNESVERFMKRYFQVATSIGQLTRSFCATLEDDKKRKPATLLERVKAQSEDLQGFVLEGERLIFVDEQEPAQNPVRMLEIFQVARRTNRDLHPRAVRAIGGHLKMFDAKVRLQPQAVEIFWDTILAPNAEIYLKKINEVGLLAKLIPDFGRLAGQMQFDMYHTYTVDEHILVAIGMLHQISTGKLSADLPKTTQLMHYFKQNKALFLAMLCHDIGKGRGGMHQAKGAVIGRRLAQEFGLNQADQELVAWLVENHQLLTDIAFKRDVQDPQVWQNAAQQIQTLQRLRMLLLMTVADVHAVGPQVWNQWKGSVLRQLYRGIERVLSKGELALDEENLAPELSSPEQNLWLSVRVPSEFWASVPEAQRHAMARALAEDPQDTKTRCLWGQDEEGGVGILSVLTQDRPGLFALLCGVISASQGNIVSCRVRTLKDGIAVDTFWLQDRDGKAFADKARQKKMEKLLLQVLQDPDILEKEIRRMQQDYGRSRSSMDVPTKVYFDQHASRDASVLEVSTADRIGLLYTIARVLAYHHVSIHAAHIVTYGPQAVDVFYIKDRYGMKIEHPARLQVMEEALLQALNSTPTKQAKAG